MLEYCNRLQIKVFVHSDITSLQTAVNNWLHEQKNETVLVDIRLDRELNQAPIIMLTYRENN